MPPKPSAGRRQTQSQPDRIYALGQAGRKTGVVLEDTGERDEHGFENPDIFSSPEKSPAGSEASDQEMDLDDGDEPGPRSTIKLQKQPQGRPVIPRARSPLKTALMSSPRRDSNIQPSSSPTRGDIYRTAQAAPHQNAMRKLDFSVSGPKLSATSRSKPNGTASQDSPFGHAARRPGGGSALNGRTLTDDEQSTDEEQPEDEEPIDLPAVEEEVALGGNDDYGEPVDDNEQSEEEPEEPEPEPEPPKPAKQIRKPGSKATRAEEPPKEEAPMRKRGRPPKKAPSEPESPKQSRQKRVHHEMEDVPEKSTNKRAKKTAEPKARGRPRRSSGLGVQSPEVQRGPPLPRARGLVSLRREDPNSMLTTRSGRHSFKPLNWWQGDEREIETEEYTDQRGERFVVNSTRGVVRHENEVIPATRQKSGKRGRPSKAMKGTREAAIEREPWELEEGRVMGECLYWYREYEHAPPNDDDPVEVIEEELAISAPAIQLKDIKDATFKFAKTLTLPFFGSGIVDLPPGSEKKPKNSRKMHMVFFVHKGTVDVTVATNHFRISEGGQFFVPRGNYYDLANNGDKKARIFFAQGCELLVDPEEMEAEVSQAP